MRNIIYSSSIFFIILFFSCISAKHKITVTVIDVDSGIGIPDIKVYVGNIEHSSSANQVKMVLTNSDGIAKLNYYSARKDAIQIRIEATNGYKLLDDNRYNYFEYQRKISLTIKVKK